MKNLDGLAEAIGGTIDQLRAENEALRKDAARMEWAERNSKDMGTHWEIRTGSQAGSLRKAIDAARKRNSA